MHTNVVTSLDTRRKKKDGTYPIVFRLGHIDRTIPISTGYSVKQADWDDRSRSVKKLFSGTTSVVRLNNLLQKKKSEMIDTLTKLDDKGTLRTMSVVEVKSRLINRRVNRSFFDYAQKQIENLMELERYGTAQTYKVAVSVLHTFHKGKDLAFTDLTYSFLTRFETYHLAKSNSPNGFSVYARAIRAIYNKAIKNGIAEREAFPFTEFQIKHVPTRKRAISVDAIKRLLAVDTISGTPLRVAQDIFKTSFYLMGANFTDLAFLKKCNVVDGRIRYERAKTGHNFDIQISDKLERVLAPYLERKGPNQFIFPIVNRVRYIDQCRDIKQARKRYNHRLRELAAQAGVDEWMTNYVSRHSFATLAKRKNIPLAAISEMLGHKSVRTTEIYLESLVSEARDAFHANVLEGV